MSTRSNLRPQVVINAGDMSQTTLTSTPTVLQSLSMVSYGVSWTGTTPVGTIAVQASNDYTVAPTGGTGNAGTWNTLPLDLNGTIVTSIPVSGNTGNGMIDIDGLAAYAIRLVYTKGSGTGSLTVTVNGKVQ